MTDGTMIRSRPRVREDEHGAEQPGDRRAGAFGHAAGAAKVAGAAVAVSLTLAGMFALLAPGQTVRGVDPRTAAAQAAAPQAAAPGTAKAVRPADPAVTGAPTGARGAKPGAVAKPVKKPSAALPPTKNLTPVARSAALVTYLTQGGVPIPSAPAEVVRAARQTCTALDSGTPARDFVADLAAAAGYTSAQSTRFVTAATHFYCPQHTRDLAR